MLSNAFGFCAEIRNKKELTTFDQLILIYK